MSSQLLFTSSSQKQFGDWGTGIENVPDTANMGIMNPNNYINDLRNTVKVPKHSELAVVNCEIDRGLTFDLNINDRFYWYWGELLTTQSVNDVGILPFPILLSEYLEENEDGDVNFDGLDMGNLTADRYAQIITEAMRNCICMPDFFRTASATIDASGAGRKLKFDITSHGNQSKTNTTLNISDYTNHFGDGGSGANPVQAWVGINRQNIGYEFYDKEDGDPDQVEWDNYFEAITIAGNEGNTIVRKAPSSAFTDKRGAANAKKRNGDWDDDCRVICRTTPLSCVDGIMDVAFAGAPTGFEIGLTRPQTYATYWYGDNITNFERPQRAEPDGDTPLTNQCDYVVKYWDEDNAGTKKIHIYELSRNIDGDDLDMDQPEGPSNMREIEYWGITTGGRPLAQITEADMFGAGKTYQWIRFNIRGNALEITLSDNVGFVASPGANVDIILTSFTDLPTRSKLPLPIGMNGWALYPLVSLPTIEEYVTFTHFSGVDGGGAANWSDGTGTTYNYPVDRKDRCNFEEITGQDQEEYQGSAPGGKELWRRPWIPGSTFYAWAVSESNARYGPGTDDWGPAGVVGWMFEYLQCRNPSLNGQDGDMTPDNPMRYKLLDDATPASAEAPELCHGIITQKGDWGQDPFDRSDNYPTPSQSDNNYSGHPPNMARKLGILYRNIFQTVDGVTSKLDGTVSANKWRGKWLVSGKDDFGEEPDIMLIEVLPFNHQSYNMSASVPSKMVYVVPKSDYRGHIDGKMFHEAHDRYYVSLNNSDDIFINQIEIRFTDKNGMTTTDLIGNSLVTLHIQPERGRTISDKNVLDYASFPGGLPYGGGPV